MSQFDYIVTGSFTSDGAAKFLDIPTGVDYMEVINFTQMATTQNPGRGVKFEWFRGLADDAAIMVSKENTADTATFETVTSGGFTLYDGGNQTPVAVGGPITGITAINDPVITTTSAHGLAVGDRVRPVGTTAMLQIAGMEFTVTAVGSTTTATLGYIDASGFAAAASAGTLYKLPSPIFEPQTNYITNITAASSAVITMSVTHGLSVGQTVRVHCSPDFGMSQIDGLSGEITAVNTTNNTITVDIDSTGFTAFAFPTSATASAGVTFPQVVPYGVTAGGSLADAVDNTSFRGMRLGAGADSPAGSTSDVIYWKALLAAQVQS